MYGWTTFVVVLRVLQSYDQMSPQIRLGTPKAPDFSEPYDDVSDNTHY